MFDHLSETWMYGQYEKFKFIDAEKCYSEDVIMPLIKPVLSDAL